MKTAFRFFGIFHFSLAVAAFLTISAVPCDYLEWAAQGGQRNKGIAL